MPTSRISSEAPEENSVVTMENAAIAIANPSRIANNAHHDEGLIGESRNPTSGSRGRGTAPAPAGLGG